MILALNPASSASVDEEEFDIEFELTLIAASAASALEDDSES